MFFAAVQSYGGELILRIVLYGLPIMAILGADALRALVRKRRWLEWVLAVGMVVLMGLLVVIRGGNDSFQVVFPQEVTMYRQVVAETPPGQTHLRAEQARARGRRGHQRPPARRQPQGLRAARGRPGPCTEEADPDVVVSFTSVEKEGVYLNGQKPGWSLQALQEILATGRYTLTYQDGYNWVVRKIPQPAGG